MLDVEMFYGCVGRTEAPEWAPLNALLPEPLWVRFMWMNTVELDDGRDLHAYKHADTRRYLYLDTDAVAYEHLDRGRYRRMRTTDALEATFGVWWLLRVATAEEQEALRV